MTQADAVGRLKSLVDFAEFRRRAFDGGDPSSFAQMKFEAAGIVASYLGAEHYLVGKIGDLQVPNRFAAAIPSMMQTESVTNEFIGLVNAAINLLDVTYGRAAPHPPICDADLWEHIEELVRIEAWSKIPAAVATFVEDWFRKRGGDPRHESGAKLVGADLFNRVLRDYPLGDQESERAGWRFLAMGLAQAIGNLHRHNIEDRQDAEQLAWGVVGLGSLLLGELRLALPGESGR